MDPCNMQLEDLTIVKFIVVEGFSKVRTKEVTYEIVVKEEMYDRSNSGALI